MAGVGGMTMHAYLAGILLAGLILSVAQAFGAMHESQLVSEEIQLAEKRPIAYHRRSEDSVAREIRRADEGEPAFVEVRSEPRPARLVAYKEPSASRVDAALTYQSQPSSKIQIGPTVGTVIYEGAWREHVSNQYSVGFLMSRPITEMAAIEIDFSTSRNFVSYLGTGHMVTQLGSTGSFRLNLTDMTTFTPYMSAGIGGNFFSGLSYGPIILTPGSGYSDWILSGVISAGADMAVSRRIRLGVRGSYQAPLLHRPYTRSTGALASPGFEDSAMLNTGFYRVMGLVMVSL